MIILVMRDSPKVGRTPDAVATKDPSDMTKPAAKACGSSFIASTEASSNMDCETDDSSRGATQSTDLFKIIKNTAAAAATDATAVITTSTVDAAAAIAGRSTTFSNTWPQEGASFSLALPEFPTTDVQGDTASGDSDTTSRDDSGDSSGEIFEDISLRVEVWQGKHYHGQVCRASQA